MTEADTSAERADQRETFRRRLAEIASGGWTPLVAQALSVREDWDHATAELEEGEAPPGPRDSEWSPWHVMNHFAGYLQTAGEALERLSRGEGATMRDQWLGDEKSFAELRSAAIRGWDRFVTALMAASASKSTGKVALRRGGELGAAELVALTILHAGDHARQMRQIRGLAADENPGAAGDLGVRRQTAH